MSLTLAPGRVLRCQHCGAHLEVEPDMSREHGYPMLHCPDCTEAVAP